MVSRVRVLEEEDDNDDDAEEEEVAAADTGVVSDCGVDVDGILVDAVFGDV